MANGTQNNADETMEAVQASAGEAQRPVQSEALAAAPAPDEPSHAELDERQAAIGETRRSGPPLPEGQEASTFAQPAAETSDEPTEVEEPRPQDR